MDKAVFLDRDGTINEEVEYLNDPDKFAFIDGSLEALKLLQMHGYRIILVTNQSGIAKGRITWEQLMKIHARMAKQLLHNGIALSEDEIFLCPHSSKEKCGCRKPNVRNFKDAEAKFGLDPKKCFVVGDKTSDVMAGKNGGYKTILVKTGYGGKDGKYAVEPDFVASNLLEAARIIALGIHGGSVK